MISLGGHPNKSGRPRSATQADPHYLLERRLLGLQNTKNPLPQALPTRRGRFIAATSEASREISHFGEWAADPGILGMSKHCAGSGQSGSKPRIVY